MLRIYSINLKILKSAVGSADERRARIWVNLGDNWHTYVLTYIPIHTATKSRAGTF